MAHDARHVAYPRRGIACACILALSGGLIGARAQGCAAPLSGIAAAPPQDTPAITERSDFLRLHYTGRDDVAPVCVAILGAFAPLITPHPVGGCTSSEFEERESGAKFYTVHFTDEATPPPDLDHDGYRPLLSYTLDQTAEYCDRFVFQELSRGSEPPIRILTNVAGADGGTVGGEPVQTLPRKCR